MPLMMEKLYDALRAGGVPDELARAAAAEAAQHELRYGAIETRFDAGDKRLSAVEASLATVETRLAAVETRLTLLTWMVSVLTAAVVAIGLPAFWLLLRVATKVGVGF